MRIWLALALVVGIAGGFASVAGAQAHLVKDFDRWPALAETAENAIDSANSTDTRLEELRTEIVQFRSEFDAARDLNAVRIATLREQLVALGPMTEEEGSVPESPDIASRRAELNTQLSTLLDPVQRADAEFVRASAIVSQIDQHLRERKTQKLLKPTPWPVNPVYWKPAVQDLNAAIKGLWNEAPEIDKDDIDLRQTLPITLFLTALGSVLILRGRNWSRMIVSSLQRFGARGFGIWRFLASLLRIILPFVGLNLLALAAMSTEYFGPKVGEMLLLFAFLGGVLLGVRWVSERVFARDDDEALIPLTPKQRAEARFHVGCITALIVFAALVEEIVGTGDPAPASIPVLMFPITVLGALSLYRIGLILRSVSYPAPDNAAVTELRASTLARVLRGVGTGAVAVAIAAPLLAAAGYFRAADAILPPYIMTMVLMGLVMALQRFAADVYGALTGQGVQARDALLPALIGFMLLALVAPLLALVWGARVTDLTEIWAVFLRGFSVGESRISPMDFITFGVIFAIGYVLTRLVQSTLITNVLPKTRMDIGGQNAVVSGLGYVGIFLAALAAITGAGIDLSSLAIVAGALSVGIGFGLQNIVSNFVSGIILLIERPISEGDWIEVGGNMGYVRDISVRSTRIETFDKTDVIVPNADLVSGTVTNYTRGNTVGRVIISIGVAYGSDTREVDRILREIAESQPMVLANPPPNVIFMGIGASTYDFQIRGILRDVNWIMTVTNDINHAVVERFADAGIEMAFPQLDVWMRNPEKVEPEPLQDMPPLSKNVEIS